MPFLPPCLDATSASDGTASGPRLQPHQVMLVSRGLDVVESVENRVAQASLPTDCR